jgi:membrane protein implicated in regulation of membrane protease activity
VGSIGATEIYLLLAIFAASCGWAAYGRGRFVVGWAVAGLIFGPLALVLILLLPPTRDRQRKVSDSSEGGN